MIQEVDAVFYLFAFTHTAAQMPRIKHLDVHLCEVDGTVAVQLEAKRKFGGNAGQAM